MSLSRFITLVLCYGHQEFADYCAEQLRGVDTLLIDNGSPEPIHSTVANVVRLPTNVYPSGGNNAAMRMTATYDYAWLVCDDMLDVSADMARGLMDDWPHADDRCACLAPNLSNSGWRHMKNHTSFDRVDWIEANPLLSLAAWRNVGEFDTRFKNWGLDIDWGLRMMAKGYHAYIDGRYTVRQRENVTRPTMDHKDPGIMARGLREKYHVSRWEDLVKAWL